MASPAHRHPARWLSLLLVVVVAASGAYLLARTSLFKVPAAPFSLQTTLPPVAISLDADTKITCGVKQDHTVWCWGLNNYGQLGHGEPKPWLSPTPLQVVDRNGQPLTQVIQVAVYSSNVCGLRSDGTVWCWGRNENDVLGDGSYKDSPFAVPAQVSLDRGDLLQAVTRISVGDHVCVVKKDGTVWCWGANQYGGAGNGGGPTPFPTRVPDPNIKNAAWIDSHSHTCMVRKDGTVWCWGWNFDRQVTPQQQDVIATPIQVLEANGQPLQNAVTVATSADQTCVLKTNGTAECWGKCGQFFGMGNPACRLRPAALHDGQGNVLNGIQSIQAGVNHMCLVRKQVVWCFGANSAGQLGDGTKMDRAEPVVSDFGVKKTVGAWSTAPGGDHTCFVGLNGKIGCWGWNDQGQLGDGTQNNSATPVVAKF